MALERRWGIMLGLTGAVGYAGHGAWHIAHGTPWDAIWICHFAALGVAGGLAFQSPLPCAAGLLCLLIGTPIWILDLLGGSPFIPTSPLTHVLGPILGFYGVRKMGIPRWSWLASLGFVAAMIVVARLVTPADANVNLAFGPAPSWHWAPKAWPLHVGWMLGFWGGLLFVLELIVRKLCNHQPHPSAI